MKSSLIATVVVLLLGCASTPEPHDASVASHEAMAREQDRQAGEHAARFDPNASKPRERCIGRGDVTDGGACWTSDVNPTKEHLEHAAQHRKEAGQHRAASQALRDVEARACAGVSDDDRDTSPFAHREDIAGVEEIRVAGTGKAPSTALLGARVTFRALPGMTREWLQRVVDCHVARNSALGHDVPDMAYCPLVPKGVRATVKSGHGGFDVEVESDDATTAQEVLRRARGAAAP